MCVIYTRHPPRDEQEAACREYAKVRGWPVRSVHHDDYAPDSLDGQPGLEAAIDDLCRADVLLVYRLDRIGGDVLIAELARRRIAAEGARVESVVPSVADPTTDHVRQVMDAVAELEREKIGQATSEAMRRAQQAGQRVGRYAPYGWAIDPNDTSLLVEDPEEQRWVARVVELRAGGMSYYAIAKQLDEEGAPTRGGAKWHGKTVKRIVQRHAAGEE